MITITDWVLIAGPSFHLPIRMTIVVIVGPLPGRQVTSLGGGGLVAAAFEDSLIQLLVWGGWRWGECVWV
jgi:hypothetical protein